METQTKLIKISNETSDQQNEISAQQDENPLQGIPAPDIDNEGLEILKAKNSPLKRIQRGIEQMITAGQEWRLDHIKQKVIRETVAPYVAAIKREVLHHEDKDGISVYGKLTNEQHTFRCVWSINEYFLGRLSWDETRAMRADYAPRILNANELSRSKKIIKDIDAKYDEAVRHNQFPSEKTNPTFKANFQKDVINRLEVEYLKCVQHVTETFKTDIPQGNQKNKN